MSAYLLVRLKHIYRITELVKYSINTCSVWPRPQPQGSGLDLGLKHLSSFNISHRHARHIVVFHFYIIVSFTL